jgi:hypothetical protein
MPLNPNYSGVQQNIQITEVSGLQSSIAAIDLRIDGETTDRLNGDVNLSNSLQALEITVNTKQPIINDGDLSISKVSGLQSAIDTKQAIINDGDLSISKVSGLQSAIDTKQAIINDGDLSISKVSGLQSAIDTKQAIINDGDLSISKVGGLQTALDSLSGGGGGGGICLECINVYCKGQTLTTKKGDSLVIENVSAVQNITSQTPTYTDITGSTISYRPPDGAKLVIYTLQTQLSGRQYDVFGNQDAQFKCFYGANEILPARVFISNNRFAFGYIEFSVCINIGGTYDPVNSATLDGWDNLQTLKWSCAQQLQNGSFQLHTKYGFTEGGLDTFSPPKIKIEAFS